MSMADAAKVPTPELDERAKLIDSGKAQVVQEFLDGLAHRGLHLARFQGDDLVLAHERPEQIMADHFGLDLDKIDAEQRALLDAIRS